VVKKKVELVHANPSHEDLDMPSAFEGSASEKSTMEVLKLIAKTRVANTRTRTGKKLFTDKAASLLNQINHITHIPNKFIKAMMFKAKRRD